MSENQSEHNCPHCSCGRADLRPEGGLMQGWALGLSSACVFLLPLLGALAGVAIFVQFKLPELAGGALGFATALAVALLITRYLSKRKVWK
jgi:hypothetical protein